MKNLIKKTAATTLSAMGILSAMPSAFCAPSGNNNSKGKIDPFHAMIVAKYLDNTKDISNLVMVNEKYKDLMEKFRFNPVEINSEEDLKKFPNIETLYIQEKENNYINTFPENSGVKRLIYFPGSFDSYKLEEILVCNDIMNDFYGYNSDWKKEVKSAKGALSDDYCVKFYKGEGEDYKEIVFLLSQIGGENLKNIYKYSDILDILEIKMPMYYGRLFKSASIPETVTSIGEAAFGDCHFLTNITIPNSVTSIGRYAFNNCFKLTNVTIPNSVTSIGEFAFNNCQRLTDVTISNSIESIENNTFDSCGSLTNVNIPNSVTSIGRYAFRDCSSLTNITIPNSVTSIEEDAFEDCQNLNHIEFNGMVYYSVNSFMEDFYAYRQAQ